MTSAEKAKMFDILGELKISSALTAERVENLKDDFLELKDSFKEHEKTGSEQYRGLEKSVDYLKGKVGRLDKASKVGWMKTLMAPKVLAAILTALSAVGGSVYAFFK